MLRSPGVVVLRRRRQVREAPNYKRRGCWCLLHPGISPPSLCRWGGGGADTQIPRLSFLTKSIFHRVDGSRKRRCLAAMRQWEVRVGCRRKKRNALPRWTEAVKQWRSLAEEEGEILACCFMSRSFIPIRFFVFFNITLFPFFPAARPLPSLRKLSSPPPPAKVNSQPVCRNIGGGRFGGGGWRGGGGRFLSPALHSQSTAHTSRRRRRRSERHRREARTDDIMRALCLGSCYPLLQTIRIIIFWGRVGPERRRCIASAPGSPREGAHAG